MVTLWNLLRDFFVEYIFGGINSVGIMFKGRIGALVTFDGTSTTSINPASSTDLLLNVGTFGGKDYAVSLGDWLSTSCTVVTLVAFVIILFLLLKWLFKVISGFILLK